MKILILGKLGFKTYVLEKHFISYSCIFISYLQCFEVCLQKSSYFSKKMFFQIFDWSNLFFDQSKSFWKILVSLCLVRLIETIFWSIEHHESGFLKHGSWLFQKKFFQKFFKFSLSLSLSLSLSPIQTWLHLRVLSFFIFPFARFLSPNTGKTLLPLLFVFIFTFHAFSCIFNLGISNYA